MKNKIEINGEIYVKESEVEISNSKPFECENHPFIGKYCIVRTYSAGVWFGKIQHKLSGEVIVENARRLWRYQCPKSISLSAVANYGLREEGSRLPAPVKMVWVVAIEMIPVADEIKDQIYSLKETEQD